MPSKPEEVFNFARRAQELQVQLRFIMEHEDRNTVFWIERRAFVGQRSREVRMSSCKPRPLMSLRS